MQQHPEPSSGDDAGTPALEQQIKQWATSLSKEPGFEAWSAATWSVYPLGPGTHSWMILLQGNGQEIGYMIIASTKEHTYKLMEYGLGPNPLFSMNTLYQSLVQRALIPDTIPYESFAQEPSMKLTRWYILPLQAVWEVQQGTTTLYLDAKTGEELPDIGSWLTGTKEIQQVLSQYPLSSGVISESQTRADFDPFMKTTWLTETPLAQLTFAQWKSTAAPELHFTYLGKLFGGRALYPLAVSGYHLWDTDCSFLRLEHEGSRFVPYMDALLAGELFSGS
ncbi:MAG: hypothetical protein K0R57_2878 [Paenibacillaceae bacterium]|nr:hypothetical protein [Paenibacillaceae bacterium]